MRAAAVLDTNQQSVSAWASTWLGFLVLVKSAPYPLLIPATGKQGDNGGPVARFTHSPNSVRKTRKIQIHIPNCNVFTSKEEF